MDGGYYQGRLAVLTGASEGIGKSLAVELARRGADVVICSRSQDKLQAATDDIQLCRRRKTQRVAYRVFDVADEHATESQINDIVEEIGAPDLLINCAGFARPGYVDQLQARHFRAMMEVNYLGTVHVCKAALRHLKDGRSHIMNVSSVAGYVGLFGNAGYCATKYAVLGFSEALRSELRPRGIRVSVLCPPNTRTPGLERENTHKPREVLAVEEKAALLEPEYVARATLKALPAGRFLIHPGIRCHGVHALSRFLPGLLRRMVERPRL